MDEEERKQKQEGSLKQKGESVVKKAQKTTSIFTKIRRIMSIPVLRWIFIIGMVIIVVVFVVTGGISFIHGMPNQARDRMLEIFTGVADFRQYGVTSETKEESLTEGDKAQIIEDINDLDNTGTNKHYDSPIVAAANDLKLKGYKIAEYGFIDLLNGDYVNEDENGMVTSIRSKYLSAYIAADNDTYIHVGDSNKQSGHDNTEKTRYSKELVREIVLNGNPHAVLDDKELEPLYNIVDTNISGSLDENKRASKEEIAQTIEQAIKMYNNSKTSDEIKITELQAANILKYLDENADTNYSDGMIVFEHGVPDGVSVQICRETKQMIVSVQPKKDKRTNPNAEIRERRIWIC